MLEPIIDELKNYWYSKQEKNEEFWKHEYQKHGSCMFTPLTELQYFSRALLLYYIAIAQDLPTYYEENSIFYIFDVEIFKKTNTRIGFNPYFYPIGFPINLDIDTEDDWNIVKLINI